MSTEVHFGEDMATTTETSLVLATAQQGNTQAQREKKSHKDAMEINWDPSDLTFPRKNMCLRKQVANTEVQSDIYAKSLENI